MEPISLSMAGLILGSMAVGAALSKIFGRKKSSCSAPSDETTSVPVDEDKERAINDLVA